MRWDPEDREHDVRPDRAPEVYARAALLIANWDPTPYDGIATEVIRDPLSQSLPRIAEQLLASAARAGSAPVRESSVATARSIVAQSRAAAGRPQPRLAIAADGLTLREWSEHSEH
jgi:hypothetical protein